MDSAFELLERRAPILGIVRNLQSNEVDDRAWLAAHNVVFRNGRVEKVKGWTAHGAAQLDGVVNLVKSVRYRSGAAATVVLTHKAGYRLNGSVAQAISGAPFPMSTTERFVADYLDKRWYFASQGTGLLRWDGVTNLELVPDCPYKGAVAAQFENHILQGDLAGVDANAAYSLVGTDLLTRGLAWDSENLESDALLEEITDGADRIQCLVRWSNVLEIYKEFSIHFLRYGGEFDYTREKQPVEMGVLARHSMSVLPSGRHYVGQENLYRFDGGSNTAFGDRIWTWWNGVLVPTGKSLTYAVVDGRPAAREINLGYRSAAGGGSVFDEALVYSCQYDAFSTRDWPFSAAGFGRSAESVASEGTFDELTKPLDDSDAPVEVEDTPSDQVLIAGDANGRLWVLDESTDKGGDAEIEMVLESGDTNFGTMQHKLCDGMGIEAPIRTGTALKVYVGVRDDLGQAITWHGPYSYLSGGFLEFDDFPEGVWFRFMFVKADGACAMSAYAPSVQVTGGF